MLVTWDRHPLETLRPGAEPKVITTPERKAELVEATGIDMLVVLPFDKEFSSWSPERFITDVLIRLGARNVFIGDGWRFGHKAAGTIDLLKKMGAEHDFVVSGLALAEVDGERVSSTRVRSAIATGDMETAQVLLARPFDVDGVVLRGDRRGTGLGFPTANLMLDRSIAHPPPRRVRGKVADPIDAPVLHRCHQRWGQPAVRRGSRGHPLEGRVFPAGLRRRPLRSADASRAPSPPARRVEILLRRRRSWNRWPPTWTEPCAIII